MTDQLADPDTPAGPRPLAEVVEAGWAQALAPVADDIAAMGQFLRSENAAGRGYLLRHARNRRLIGDITSDDVRAGFCGERGEPVGTACERDRLPAELRKVANGCRADS